MSKSLRLNYGSDPHHSPCPGKERITHYHSGASATSMNGGKIRAEKARREESRVNNLHLHCPRHVNLCRIDYTLRSDFIHCFTKEKREEAVKIQMRASKTPHHTFPHLQLSPLLLSLDIFSPVNSGAPSPRPSPGEVQ